MTTSKEAEQWLNKKPVSDILVVNAGILIRGTVDTFALAPPVPTKY
jgi:hypothetical protein